MSESGESLIPDALIKEDHGERIEQSLDEAGKASKPPITGIKIYRREGQEGIITNSTTGTNHDSKV